ncbi:hypothetical protein HAX54_013096 [Datura stramonium]|uniref:HMA domain-containing protein n=1 Tax=Datura stramonium TaxID=4076 RepID=A0ABS8RY49_DATST|nr:hypothetical protein [Datura stramonium]
MGEENKVEGSKEEKKEEGQVIVLKVDMHCEGCARKVARALKGLQGVEEVTMDYETSKVVVKGKNADPFKPPPEITVVLNVQMHCDACAQLLQKRIRKIKGVECVTTDLEKNQVIVKGVNIDPEMLVIDLYKRSGKQVSVVNNTIFEEKKEEEEKDNTKEEEEEEDIMKNYNLAQKYNYNNMEYYPNYYPQEIFSDDNPHACSLM